MTEHDGIKGYHTLLTLGPSPCRTVDTTGSVERAMKCESRSLDNLPPIAATACVVLSQMWRGNRAKVRQVLPGKRPCRAAAGISAMGQNPTPSPFRTARSTW
jgi:hypothetical protein